MLGIYIGLYQLIFLLFLFGKGKKLTVNTVLYFYILGKKADWFFQIFYSREICCVLGFDALINNGIMIQFHL